MDVAATLQDGLAAQRAGRLPEAAQAYRQVLISDPDNFECLHLLGLVEFQRGDQAEALQCLGRAVEINGNVPALLNNYGIVLNLMREHRAALNKFERAIALAPNYAPAHLNRGRALGELGRTREAIASFELAIVLDQNSCEPYNELGKARASSRDFVPAIESFDRAVILQPDFGEAHSNRGMALMALKRHGEAVESFDRAVALQPDNLQLHRFRANALMRCNRLEEALFSFDRVAALDPDPETLNNRGVALQALGRLQEALASFDQSIALSPERADSHSNRGGVLAELKRYAEAIDSCDHAIKLQLNCASAHYNRGLALDGLRKPEDAILSYDAALAYDPTIVTARGKRLHTRMKICQWDGIEEDTRTVLAEIAAGKLASPPYTLVALPSSLQQQKDAAELYVRMKVPATRVHAWPSRQRRDAKYRIGYFSADFYAHATAYLTAGMFEEHDRSEFEIIGFSFGRPGEDEMTRRLDAAFPQFFDVSAKSDKEVAALARDLNIDIAVDLKGHAFETRPGVFAHRAAPIQVNYLGYPGTMGMDAIDYLIADPIVIPPEHRQFYTEKIAYLPDTYQANDAKVGISDRVFTRSELGLPEHAFVFCCFNNIYKLTPAVFDVWMRLLGKVEGSVLWLLQDDGPGIANLRLEAQKRDISGDRLIFARRMGPGEHLARHRAADLFLDTFFYNAHTTATDALRAGLPLVTMLGDTFAGRVAASLLTAAGLTDMITPNPQAYEDLALELATAPDKLTAVKARLAQNIKTYPLLDTKGFTRNIEKAYRRMWEIYEAGGAPEHFNI